MQAMAGEIINLREKTKTLKTTGSCWWIDGRMNVHLFVASEKRHPQRTSIYAKLQDVLEKLSLEGYSLLPSWELQPILDDGKDDQCGHAVMLAIACALINTPLDMRIHVIQNMRICADCHFSAALTSGLEKRKILIKDSNILHVLEDGICVCENDYL